MKDDKRGRGRTNANNEQSKRERESCEGEYKDREIQMGNVDVSQHRSRVDNRDTG